MAIDFTLAPEHAEIRERVRAFVDDVIKPAMEPFGHREEMDKEARRAYVGELIRLRKAAVEAGLWLPHMPAEWGGMGLGHVALAMVQAEAAKTRVGPWVFNCQAPDEGNMHTLLHWATDEQKEKYLKPLCDGFAMSCFAMTAPGPCSMNARYCGMRCQLQRSWKKRAEPSQTNSKLMRALAVRRLQNQTSALDDLMFDLA